MKTFLKRLFGLDKFEFICTQCASPIKAGVPLRKRVVRRVCNCGTTWLFDWKGDRFDVKTDPPFSTAAVEGQGELQSDSALADFIARRNRGEFGARNEAELQEIWARDEENCDVE